MRDQRSPHCFPNLSEFAFFLVFGKSSHASHKRDKKDKKDKISELDFNVPKNMFGTNQGLSPKGLKFASLVSEFANGPLDYTIENFIHEYLSDVFHKNYFEGYGLFDLDARKQYLSAFSNSNKELANKFLCRDSLFLDEIKEEKIDVNLNFEDIARVVMSMGMKFDKKLKDMKCDKS